ncbi:MAG: hypothetical protein ACRDBG_23490 [Waterburya sp.]
MLSTSKYSYIASGSKAEKYILALTGWDLVKMKDYLLRGNDEFFRAAVIAIDKHQTSQERSIGGTVDDNGIGWGAYDGAYMMVVAAAYRGETEKAFWDGRAVRDVVTAKLRMKMVKYASQLLWLTYVRHSSQQKEAA